MLLLGVIAWMDFSLLEADNGVKMLLISALSGVYSHLVLTKSRAPGLTLFLFHFSKNFISFDPLLLLKFLTQY